MTDDPVTPSGYATRLGWLGSLTLMSARGDY
jgi:hypothetical protein